MTSLGETLRRERLKQNLDLNRVSSELKISSRLLDAIEQERFDRLPGGVFTRSFVRQYARYLRLDEDEISSELQRLLDPPPAMPSSPNGKAVRPEENIPLPRMEGWNAVGDRGTAWSSVLPRLGMVIVMMLACSAIYSWWQRARHPALERPSAPAIAQATAEPTQATPPVAAAETPAARPEEKQEVAAASETPGEKETPGAEVRPVAAEAPVQGAIRVDITAEEPVWVSARTDGKYVFSVTLNASESRSVAGDNSVVLRLGNAGGASISLNGKPIGAVGPKGQIRTVQFTSGGFQIVLPEAPKPSPIDVSDPL
jgi:cytoskeleton protein RodZ